jgi:uncharacterized membrane protein YesL
MAIYNIYLDLENDYINLIKDCYKVIVILVVFQALVHYSGAQKNILNTALTGSLLNDEFITLLFFVLIGISSYYLIFDKLLSIN